MAVQYFLIIFALLKQYVIPSLIRACFFLLILRKTRNLSLELNLICEFYSNIASQSFTLSAALTLRAVSQPVKCFGISVTGLTHQKQSQGLQRRHTVSTAPFMFCSGSLQFHVSQQQVRQKKIMGPTCCYQAFPQLQ